MTIDLSLKRMLARGLTGLSDFKGLMGYRQSPLFSSSRRRTEGGLSCVQTEGRGGGSIQRLKLALFAGWRQKTLQHLDWLSRRRQPEKLPSQAKVLFYRARCWSLTAIPYRCIKPSFTISQLTRRSNHFFSFTTPQHPIAPMIITSAPAAMRMLAAVLNPPSSIRAE